MENSVSHLPPGDPSLITNIVNHLKSQGIFDQFRRDCLADVDTKPSYQNLRQRVEGYVSKFLSNETWHPDLNKNQLRNTLRRQIDESGMLALGVEHVVEQVVNAKMYQVFLPKIEDMVKQYLGLKMPNDKQESGKSNEKQDTACLEPNTVPIPVEGTSKLDPKVTENLDETAKESKMPKETTLDQVTEVPLTNTISKDCRKGEENPLKLSNIDKSVESAHTKPDVSINTDTEIKYHEKKVAAEEKICAIKLDNKMLEIQNVIQEPFDKIGDCKEQSDHNEVKEIKKEVKVVEVKVCSELSKNKAHYEKDRKSEKGIKSSHYDKLKQVDKEKGKTKSHEEQKSKIDCQSPSPCKEGSRMIYKVKVSNDGSKARNSGNVKSKVLIDSSKYKNASKSDTDKVSSKSKYVLSIGAGHKIKTEHIDTKSTIKSDSKAKSESLKLNKMPNDKGKELPKNSKTKIEAEKPKLTPKLEHKDIKNIKSYCNIIPKPFGDKLKVYSGHKKNITDTIKSVKPPTKHISTVKSSSCEKAKDKSKHKEKDSQDKYKSTNIQKERDKPKSLDSSCSSEKKEILDSRSSSPYDSSQGSDREKSLSAKRIKLETKDHFSTRKIKNVDTNVSRKGKETVRQMNLKSKIRSIKLQMESKYLKSEDTGKQFGEDISKKQKDSQKGNDDPPKGHFENEEYITKMCSDLHEKDSSDKKPCNFASHHSETSSLRSDNSRKKKSDCQDGKKCNTPPPVRQLPESADFAKSLDINSEDIKLNVQRISTIGEVKSMTPDMKHEQERCNLTYQHNDRLFSSSSEDEIQERLTCFSHSIHSDAKDISSKYKYTKETEAYMSHKETASKSNDDIDDEEDKKSLSEWSDVTISSVHTSDLSSFDDRISLSSSDEEMEQRAKKLKKVKKKVPLKEVKQIAQKLDDVNEEEIYLNQKDNEKQNLCDTEKNNNVQGRYEPSSEEDNEKSSILSTSDQDEPAYGDSIALGSKRELRRERKLNPKYASSDYASIFTSNKIFTGTEDASNNYLSGYSSHDSSENLKENHSSKKQDLKASENGRMNQLNMRDVNRKHRESNKASRNSGKKGYSNEKCERKKISPDKLKNLKKYYSEEKSADILKGKSHMISEEGHDLVSEDRNTHHSYKTVNEKDYIDIDVHKSKMLHDNDTELCSNDDNEESGKKYLGSYSNDKQSCEYQEYSEQEHNSKNFDQITKADDIEEKHFKDPNVNDSDEEKYHRSKQYYKDYPHRKRRKLSETSDPEFQYTITLKIKKVPGEDSDDEQDLTQRLTDSNSFSNKEMNDSKSEVSESGENDEQQSSTNTLSEGGKPEFDAFKSGTENVVRKRGRPRKRPLSPDQKSDVTQDKQLIHIQDPSIPKRGRPRKRPLSPEIRDPILRSGSFLLQNAPKSSVENKSEGALSTDEYQPPRKRGRPRKHQNFAQTQTVSVETGHCRKSYDEYNKLAPLNSKAYSSMPYPTETLPKRGRPRKYPAEESSKSIVKTVGGEQQQRDKRQFSEVNEPLERDLKYRRKSSENAQNVSPESQNRTESHHSSKRYDSSDLYKPRPVISSGTRRSRAYSPPL